MGDALDRPDKAEPLNSTKRLIRLLFPRWLINFFRGAGTSILASYFKRRNVARTAFIDKSVHVLGWRSVVIGEDTILSQGCWLNVNHRNEHQDKIKIGKRSYIGRDNFFTSGALIELKDYAMTSVFCSFIGSSHYFSDPFRPYIWSGVLDDAEITLGVNCQLGAGVTIVGNVKIGHGCIIGANTLVNKNVPPFSVVVGNPGRVIKRYDVETKTWIAADLFTAEKERLIPDEAAYLAILDAAQIFPGMPLHAAGRSMGDLP